MVYFNFGIPKGEKGDKGDTGPAPDMSNYVSKTDILAYPTYSDVATPYQTGVIMGNADKGFQVNQAGRPYAITYVDSQYPGLGNDTFIGKGTLNNVLDEYVKNTDYANGTTGGVFRTNNKYATQVNSYGYLQAQTNTNEQYQNADNLMFISKGTLDNVLTAQIGNIQTLLDNLDVGNGVE